MAINSPVEHDRVLNTYIVRETPWWFKIVEIVADMRGMLYIKTVDIGTKSDMEQSYRQLYGKAWVDQPPIDSEMTRTRRSRVPTGRAQQSRPYADLD